MRNIHFLQSTRLDLSMYLSVFPHIFRYGIPPELAVGFASVDDSVSDSGCYHEWMELPEWFCREVEWKDRRSCYFLAYISCFFSDYDLYRSRDHKFQLSKAKRIVPAYSWVLLEV